MKFIERTFGLPPVTQRDASASDLMEALNSNYNAQYNDDSFSIQGTPTYSNLAAAPALDSYASQTSISLSYMNNQDHPQAAVFYTALRNSYNQTIQLTTTRTTLPEERTVQIPFIIQNQPSGVYTVNVIAMTAKGVALSTPFRLIITSTEMTPDTVSSVAR